MSTQFKTAAKINPELKQYKTMSFNKSFRRNIRNILKIAEMHLRQDFI